jgi:hypothetical protein
VTRGAEPRRGILAARPRSSVDRAADFESACGGSIPPGAISSRLATPNPRGCVGQACQRPAAWLRRTRVVAWDRRASDAGNARAVPTGTTGSKANPLSGDHKVPVSEGGTARMVADVVVACRSCNSSRGGRLNAVTAGAVTREPVFGEENERKILGPQSEIQLALWSADGHELRSLRRSDRLSRPGPAAEVLRDLRSAGKRRHRLARGLAQRTPQRARGRAAPEARRVDGRVASKHAEKPRADRAKPKGARASEAGRLMDRLILSRRSGKNVLKPGLRPSSPHRWRLASRRGQTPGPGFTRSSRQVSSAASPVGVTLPARFGGEPARSPGVCSGIQTSSGPLLERLATGITR